LRRKPVVMKTKNRHYLSNGSTENRNYTVPLWRQSKRQTKTQAESRA